MAAIDWPSSLPLPESGQLKELYVSPFADDQSEVGAARRRKRFTRTLRSFSLTLFLNATQRATLETFVEETTDAGVLSFNWTHPTKGTIYEVRFGSDGLPQITHSAVDYWTADISLQEI